MKLKDCLREIANPSTDYRSLPFWSWNGLLEEEELRWQVNEHKKAGLGGYFMHARGGLRTPYMGDEWMTMVRACVEEGEKVGIDSWLYDENGWPSGSSDGKVPEKSFAYQQKFLLFETLDKDVAEQKRSNAETIEVYQFDGEYIRAYYEVNPYYIDGLNAEAVKEFIETTYEVYYEEFGDYFGNAIKGIFTDEPQYGRLALPWSTVLEDAFMDRYGYSIKEALLSLYLDVDDYAKYRYDYFNLVTELFTRSFSKQIADWCEAHNCQLTGHVLLEETIGDQVMNSGSAMGFYQYMQLPGIDWLRRRIGDPVVVKQVASVAAQLEKKQTISESFGCSGENLSFAEMKWIAEWQYVLGINLLCPHLEGYTLKGLCKRDCPPGLFYQQPWWEEYSDLQDYFARLGMLLTEGESISPVLIIHPMRSGWIGFEYSHYDEAKRTEHIYTKGIDRELIELSEALSLAQFDYHYGDEEIMREHSSTDGKQLKVGACSYEVVVIPPSVSLDRSTVDLLEGFIANGGKVIGFEAFPTMCEGREDAALEALKSKVQLLPWDLNNAVDTIEQSVQPGIAKIETIGTQNDAIYTHVRSYEEGYIVFAVNLDQEKEFDAELYFMQGNAVSKLDLHGKGKTVCTYETINESMKVHEHFAPMQSYVYVITTEDDIVNVPDDQVSATSDQAIEWTQEHWDITGSDHNVYTLDYANYKLEDMADWSSSEPTIVIQNKLIATKYEGDIELQYEFDSTCDFTDEDLYLVVEEPERFKISINGEWLDTEACDWYMDKAFKKIPIKGKVIKGKNKVYIKGDYHNSSKVFEIIEKGEVSESEKTKIFYESEIEAVYLVGDFEVANRDDITEGDRKALWFKNTLALKQRRKHLTEVHDVTAQGYPFFRGRMKLGRTFNMKSIDERRYILRFKEVDASLANVYVNGNDVGKLMWAPHEVDITEYIKEGDNRLLLELVSSNRNMLGPHHNLEGEMYAVSPDRFEDFGNWTDDYCVVSFGINGAIDLVIR